MPPDKGALPSKVAWGSSTLVAELSLASVLVPSGRVFSAPSEVSEWTSGLTLTACLGWDLEGAILTLPRLLLIVLFPRSPWAELLHPPHNMKEMPYVYRSFHPHRGLDTLRKVLHDKGADDFS